MILGTLQANQPTSQSLLLEQAQRMDNGREEKFPCIPKMTRHSQRQVSDTSALSYTRATNQPSSIAQPQDLGVENEINCSEKWKSRVHTDRQNKVEIATDHATGSIIANIPSQDNLSRPANATKTPRIARRKFRKLIDHGVSQEEASKLCLMSWDDIFRMFPELQLKAIQKQPEDEPQTAQNHTNEAQKKDGQASAEVSRVTKVTKQQFSSSNTAPLRIGIRNSEPMDETQMKMVHRHLIVSIMEQFTDGSGPEFLSFTHKVGWILVTCVNKHSFDWLVQEIQYLEPWSGAQLSVIPECELPDPPKVVALIPGSEASSVQEALDLLRVQNQGLNTEHWQILHERVERSNNRTITFIIDEASLETLKAQNCEVALGFQMVTFRIKAIGTQFINPPAAHNKDPQQSNSARGDEIAALHVVAKDLPKPVKMAWKTKIRSGVDLGLVLRVMQRYNPGLRTEQWKVVDTVATDFGCRRIVLMDRFSANVIKESGYRLQTGIDLSLFKLLEDADALRGWERPLSRGGPKYRRSRQPQ